mgnify:FL=1
MVCGALVSNKHKFAVLIDESTTISKSATMILYIRTSFDGMQPVTFFLDLVELQCFNAASITLSLLQCLNKHGFSDEFIKEHFVEIGV